MPYCLSDRPVGHGLHLRRDPFWCTLVAWSLTRGALGAAWLKVLPGPRSWRQAGLRRLTWCQAMSSAILDASTFHGAKLLLRNANLGSKGSAGHGPAQTPRVRETKPCPIFKLGIFHHGPATAEVDCHNRHWPNFFSASTSTIVGGESTDSKVDILRSQIACS